MLLDDYLSFLETAPTSWHCVFEVKRRLLANGFLPLEEESLWNLQKGKKYFISRGGSIAAFCIPNAPVTHTIILGAHTDSPALKVKPNPLVLKNGMTLMQTEVYGGPILHSWLNRDLALAGRLFTENSKGCIEEKLIFLKETPFIIPELAIHLHRTVNDEGPLLNKQEHLMPIISTEPISLEELLGTPNLLSYDLFLVPTEAPQTLGLNKEWIASYRIDNLTSVHAALSALLSYEDSEILPFLFFADHEEIGSKSWEGAGSSFLNDILSRLQSSFGFSEEEFLIFKKKSLCFSLDMAHALNPMHPSKHDPSERPMLGKGLTLKYSADLKYASSGLTIAKAISIAKKANIPLQHFTPRADMPCGSTIGPIFTSSSGIQTVDLGCPQFSMHSIRELVAVKDYLDCVFFLKETLKKS
jgi:aspartyl aminopeptidase